MNRSTRRRAARAEAREARIRVRSRRSVAVAATTSGLLLAGTTAVVHAPAAHATCNSSANVFNAADTGVGSLRDAVNSVCSGGTVFFFGVANQTITLTSPITLDRFLTLDGTGQNVTVSGGDTTRILELDPTLTGTGTFTLQGLTLTHGRVNNANGADLNLTCGSTGIDVALSGVTVSYGSPTTGTISNGAGASVRDCGTVTVTGSTFSHNTTTNGGPGSGSGAGLFIRGSGNVTITDSTFSYNSAGGALRVQESGTVTISGTDFDHNSSNGPGGAIELLYSGALSVTGGSFTDNRSEIRGGAISAYYSDSVTLTDTSFSDNSAMYFGGALYADQLSSGLTITGTTFDHNDAAGAGAIFVNDDAGPVSIDDSTFTYNDATNTPSVPGSGHAGAIETLADLTVTGSTFAHNTSVSEGGAIWAVGEYTDLSVATSTFTTNSGSSGGSISAQDRPSATPGFGSVEILASTFDGNSTGLYGSGGALQVSADDGSVLVANSTFTGNSAWQGGAILLRGEIPFTLAQSTLTGNTAGADGGGLYLYNGAAATTISGSIVVGNSATYYGDDVLGYLYGGLRAVTATGSLIGEDFGINLYGDSGSGALIADVHLGALADNGGPTKTMALGAGSVAIDAGPDPVATFPGNTTDQRGTGYDRVVNGRADIGAFEVQAALPPPPTGVTLTGGTGRSVHVAWTAPASGPTPTGYQVRCLPNGYPTDVGPGGAVIYAGSATTQVDVHDLLGAQTYVCHVKARYGAQYFSWLGDSDEGPLSDPSNTLAIAATTPPTPQSVRASTPPLPSGQATSVTFTAPENRSGSAISRYEARCTSTNGGTTRIGTGGGSPVGVGSLTKGRSYQCAVRAVNPVGPSAWSANSATIVVPAGPVTNVRASTPTASNRRTTVSFTAPDGGPTPTRYWVQCRSTDGTSTLTSSEVRSPVVVANLVRGKTYACNVWAVYPGGNGPASAASNTIRVP